MQCRGGLLQQLYGTCIAPVCSWDHGLDVLTGLQEHEWACAECGQAYDTTALEAWMVQIVQQRAQAYQLQDLCCRRCRQVCILSW